MARSAPEAHPREVKQLTAHQLRIVAPDPVKDAEPLFDLFAKVFADMLGYYDGLRIARETYFRNSPYDWSTARIGLIGEQIVTHFGVLGYDMRIGTARVRVAGGGGVATHGDYRKRGLMDSTARAALAAMREQGYDMTMLFGIPDFYHRFGYVRAWPHQTIFVAASDLPRERPAAAVRRFKPRPRQDLRALHNRHYAAATGSAVRPFYRKGYAWTKPLDGYLWTGRNGKPGGYVIVQREGGRLWCYEYCGGAEQALRVLAMLARRWDCEEARFETIPLHTELVKRLLRGNCRTETRHRRSGGPMVRMINLHTTLAKMSRELGRRLRASPLADWRGDLLVADPRDEVLLRIASGQVKVGEPRPTRHAIRGGEAIAQLVLGTDRPREVIEGGGIRLSGDARWLVEALFPRQWPELSALDRY